MTTETARDNARWALLERHPGLDDDIDRGLRAAEKVYVGDWADFETFCLEHFAPPGPERDAVAAQFDRYLGSIYGNAGVTTKELCHGMHVDEGPLTGADRLFASVAPGAHIQQDLRDANIAAAIQLCFGGMPDDPEDLRERTADEWLALQLSRVGTELVPAALRQAHTTQRAEAEELVQGYNLYPGRILFDDPEVTFPSDLRLISHWGLRDHMTGLSGSGNGALPRQKAILSLLERVVRGDVPETVIDNPDAHWDIPGGTVSVDGSVAPATGEGDRRWRPFHGIFQTQRQIDRHTRRPNLIDTMFLEYRKIPEARVEAMLTDLLGSDLIGRVARHVERRTGRPLEPFDIYFKRFQEDPLDTERLSGITSARFPDRDALQEALPDIIEAVGFPKDEASLLAGKIRIDRGRGAGHAWPPATSTDVQLLRMRISDGGVVWQEFDTFMHELGHCVEGVLSSYGMPYRMLWGVPATAFSEAFAFTFQDLGLKVVGEAAQRDPDIEMIQRVWEAFEIAGPALVEMRLFRWLYEHPEATAVEIHTTVQSIGDDVWAEFHARVFGADGHGLMSVYSHMLWGDLYLAEYPLGYIIAYQVRRHLAGRDLAAEMTRVCRLGDIYPDAWMMKAVGERVSVEPMLADAAAALDRLGL